jgi:DNA-binding protein HU-beta
MAGVKGGIIPSQGKPAAAAEIAKKPYLSIESMVRVPPNRLCGHGVWRFAKPHGFIEEGPLMATAPGKAPTPTTVTLKHLAAALAETHEMSKKQAEAVLGDFVGNIVKHLKKGERIRIGGLGILQVRKRAARMGRNPATGEAIQIKASKKVAFRASKELKESV